MEIEYWYLYPPAKQKNLVSSLFQESHHLVADRTQLNYCLWALLLKLLASPSYSYSPCQTKLTHVPNSSPFSLSFS
jgi:hypothetical protein